MTALFGEDEKVFLEVSRKCHDDIPKAISLDTSMDLVQQFCVSRKYFCDVILEKTAQNISNDQFVCELYFYLFAP